MLVVTTASASLRLAQPRPDCDSWPGCRDVVQTISQASASAGLAQPETLAVVRMAHRVAASLVLLLSIALTWLAFARRPRHRLDLWLAAGLVMVALALSAIGVMTPGSRSGVILVANLLGGMLMLALAWCLALVAARDSAATRTAQAASVEPDAMLPPYPPTHRASGGGRWLQPLAALAILAWGGQAALGALSGAGIYPSSGWLHLGLALAVAPMAMGVAVLASRAGLRTQGTALLLIVALQVIAGIVAAYLAAPASLVLLHNVVAVGGFAFLAGCALPVTAPSR